jgi:hypothetical protein
MIFGPERRRASVKRKVKLKPLSLKAISRGIKFQIGLTGNRDYGDHVRERVGL